MNKQTKRSWNFIFALVWAALVPAAVNAEVAVIAHPSQNLTVSPDELERIFLGKLKQVDGQSIVPINLKMGSPVRKDFNEKVLGKTESQLKSYWSRLVFTGKAQPPKDVESESEMLELIARNPNMVGYIDKSNLTPAVKLIASF